MIVMKAWYHIIAMIQHFFYKCLYGGNLQIGKHVTWRRGFSIMKAKESRVMIGDECFFNNDCSIAANNLVDIGMGCLFGEGVKIYDHNHRFSNRDIPLKKQGYTNGEVHIGRNCWIGSGVIILKGANISDNCVVGAGCVITGHIEAGSLVKQNSGLMVEQIKERETSNDYNKSTF